MRLRELNIGCFGGGTGLPSLLGGLKTNPWLHLNAVVTMFDSGGRMLVKKLPGPMMIASKRRAASATAG